jgi:predicted  nucleic acid-binding Zn-ribbon protein
MPNSLLDKLTWNFIHERQTVDGIEYLKSVSIKINKVITGSLSKENRSYLNTALNDLTEINRYVNKLLGNITQLESENQNLKKEVENLSKKIEKAKATKE